MPNNISLCKEAHCNNMAMLSGYCRAHYLKNWRSIKLAESKEHNMSFDEYVKHALMQKLLPPIDPTQEVEVVAEVGWVAEERREQTTTTFDAALPTDEDLDSILDDLTYIDG